MLFQRFGSGASCPFPARGFPIMLDLARPDCHVAPCSFGSLGTPTDILQRGVVSLGCSLFGSRDEEFVGQRHDFPRALGMVNWYPWGGPFRTTPGENSSAQSAALRLTALALPFRPISTS